MARKVGLTLDQVLSAASEVADREGLGAATLARVADMLGVRSPSLYSHVDGLPGLRRRMALDAASRLGDDIGDAIRGRAGVDALTALAHAYREFARAHPGLYAAMLPALSCEDDEEAYLAFAAPVGEIGDVLAGVGVAEGDRVAMVRALHSALHGFVTLEAAGGLGLPDDIEESFSQLVDVVVAGITTPSRRRISDNSGGERRPV
jgi:AcrR family transcriptional regulator